LAGETLVGILFATGIGSLVLLSLAAIYMFSARSFTEMANYMDLDGQSRLAMDLASRDIRRADRLSAYATNQLTFLFGTNQIRFTYDSSNKTLVRATATNSTVLLKDCDYLRFDILQKTPSNGAYEFYPAATATNCKIVQLTWTCSRKIYGTKANTANVQAAKIVIRSQK